MTKSSLKLFVILTILFTVNLSSVAVSQTSIPTYKVFEYKGDISCVFKTLLDRVAISQPKIMGYTPYIWKDEFNDVTSSGTIDGMLPDGTKIMTFMVSLTNSKSSKIEIKLSNLSISNIEIIDTIFRQFDPNSCAPK